MIRRVSLKPVIGAESFRCLTQVLDARCCAGEQFEVAALMYLAGYEVHSAPLCSVRNISYVPKNRGFDQSRISSPSVWDST